MKTLPPSDMIEVSYNSSGKPRSCFVSVDRMERRASGGCVSMHNADGTLKMTRWPGDFDWTPALLNVKNIIVRGTPRLPDGWEVVTQAAYDALWQEMMGARLA